MYKITVLSIAMLFLALTSINAQTIGEKYQLPEEAGELRTDGVYELPVSLSPDGRTDLKTYLRFFEDGTFIVFHSRLSPTEKPKNFQINCNYQHVAEGAAPFNKDFTLRTHEGISRAKIDYGVGKPFLLLEMDVRKDVIAMQIKTFNEKGRKVGKPGNFVVPFYHLDWPVARIFTSRRR